MIVACCVLRRGGHTTIVRCVWGTRLKKLIEYLKSPSRARRVLMVYWVLLAVSTHMPDPGLGNEFDPLGMFQLDKAIHVLAFGGLALLLFCSRVLGERAAVVGHALVAALIAGAYALVDEYTQRWAGRMISAGDVLAGFIGIVGVFLAVTAPPPRGRAPWSTQAIRIVAVLAIVFIVVMALAPAGNRWFNEAAGPFFVPWPGIDKAGHFYASAVITLILAASFPLGVHRPRHGMIATILVMGLAGPIIETAQSFTGRGAEMADLFAHQLGLFTAMLGLSVLAVGRAVRTHKARRPLEDG